VAGCTPAAIGKRNVISNRTLIMIKRSDWFTSRVARLAAVLLLSALALPANGQTELTELREPDLIEVLRSGAPPEKAIACKQLAVHGTEEAVPELAKLLSDDRLASWSRIALEAIPDRAADEALRA